MSRNNSIALLIAVAVLGSAGCAKQAAPAPPKPVKVTPVVNYAATANGTQGSRYSATIQANSEVSVAFKVGGYVQSLREANGRPLDAGDYVRRGEVLAMVRQSDYLVKVEQSQAQTTEARVALRAAQAQLQEALKAVEVTKAQIVQAQATYDKARKDWERAQHLYAKQSLTRSDYDAAQAQHDTSQASLTGAQAQLRSAEARVETARKQVEQAQAKIGTSETVTREAQIPLGDTVLRAPSDGVVVNRKVEVGSLVDTGTVAFTIAEIGEVKAVFGVPDTELRTLKVGETLTVTSDAVPDRQYPAHITHISPSADPTNRVFEVEALINNYDSALKLNMVVSLETPGTGAQATKGTQVPVIPLSSVMRSKTDKNAYAVYLAEGAGEVRTARERVITLGDTFGNVVAVTSGVGVGDPVITTGATLVTDGDRIQVTP